jgi:hypothetical protein
VTAQERAEATAHDLTRAVTDLCAERYGDEFRPGDYAVIIRAVVGLDGNITFTWDWFWKPDSGGGGGSG